MTLIRSGCVLALMAAAAWGGTILTTNLPVDTAIVNVSGTEDGAATANPANSPAAGDPAQTYWYSPFNLNNTLLTYDVTPGTYSFRIVNPTDAATLFPSLTGPQLSQIYTAWTYNHPWVSDYLVFAGSAAIDPNEYQLFTGAVTPLAHYPGFADAATTYTTAKSEGYYDEIVAGLGGRYNGTTATTYTFATAQTLIFVVPDYALSDNAGGVSVLIQKLPSSNPPGLATPEPSSALLLVAGLAAIGLRRRHAGM